MLYKTKSDDRSPRVWAAASDSGQNQPVSKKDLAPFKDYRFLLCRNVYGGIEVTSYEISTRGLITRHKQGNFVSVEL